MRHHQIRAAQCQRPGLNPNPLLHAMPSLTPCTACTAQAALGADQLQYTSASVLDPGIVYIQVWRMCGLIWGDACTCGPTIFFSR